MEISQTGIDLIKSFEGFKSKAYKAVSTEKYYTIGYGHYGADVKANQVITETEAEKLLKTDLATAVKHVNTFQSKYNFNQNQFDALVSFAYNVGSITQLTAKGTRTISQISSKITAYNKSGGKVLPGLTKRRAKEKQLFDTAVTANVTYYSKYTGTSDSVVDALKAVGENDTSLAHRKQIAKTNNISYATTAVMNIAILSLLKSGKLVKG